MKLNWEIVKQFWVITKPYWTSSERWKAIALLLLLFLLSIISVGILVIVSILLGEITNTLAARDAQSFTQVITIFIVTFILGVPLLSSRTFVQGKLSIYWRRWLTDYFLSRYFAQRTYYHLQSHSEIDNPDQRISEDLNIFTQQALNFWVIFVESLMQLVGFAGALWAISPTLMGVLVLYAFIGNILVITLFGGVLVGINYEQLKREANFRFGLAQIRDNAEMIAFYDGQHTESQQMQHRLLAALRNLDRLIRWQFSLNLFQNGYQYLTFLLPLFILAPSILAGEQKVGAFDQAVVAFRSVLISLAIVISQFEKLSLFASSVTRLYGFLQQTQTHQILERNAITFTQASAIALHDLTLCTPSQKTLIRELSLTVNPGQSLLITGVSGVGKTSLLRAIAGLWHYGSGHITRPAQQHLLFLPQRPYMILGSLRQQLLYPNSSFDTTERHLIETLHQVNLAHLITDYNLDAIADWSRVLSLGEQQRLAFARLFITCPSYAILDESTSALDEYNEALLYQQLQATSITYISVGHRSSLRRYHQQLLHLQPIASL
ncbi:ABC transporter domain-containing protein (plasmid) [Gloeocapsa sp. PCC 7428]|uniref:ABC transporter ATP-binding protein/permease n=1 Tax=Gloeocapsa sp. PCC 7428 TaxID=1173026 RepID=UPI0002A61A35|nr:ABC transporter ATP-binding protein/permease [Gloeocapsa sp. PCC 7428]AFZ33395.1 ABC transporter domain-containing protein [Gloeocapsa sp. PCC 7428]